MYDLALEDHGSIFLFAPVSPLGQAFLDETAPEDAQFTGDAMAVERGYVGGVLDAAAEYGCVIFPGSRFSCPVLEEVGDASN